jgi:hypothetical protein
MTEKRRSLIVYIVMALVGILLLAVPALAQDAAENKFAGDSPGGGVAPQPTGGPDTFGYSWSDQSTGSCDYQFIDITGTGTQVFDGDDVSSGAISLGGNDISFYGTTYTDLNMTSNGYISTDPTDGGPDLSNDCPLPVTPSTGGGARIYSIHDDLISTGYYEWVDPCPRPADNWDHSGGNSPGCHVFQYDNVTHFGGTGATFAMEVLVYGITNEIVVMAPDGVDENGSGSTTGIQNGTASDGLTYACNDVTTFPTGQDTAVCFFEPSAPTDVSLSGFGGDMTGSPMWSVVAIALLTVAAMGIFVTLRSRQEA